MALNPALYRADEIQRQIEHDLKQLDAIIAQIDPLTPEADDKLHAFKQTLQACGGEKVIIFSYFKDTARYIYHQLTAAPAFASQRIGLISSDVAGRERQRMIERFAPRSNSAPADIVAELDVLISTDVLSEGQNLQDAGRLIKYDLHWNPTRMIQRNGRIDRLGSPHEAIEIANIFPDAELETLLRLVERIQTKLSAINETIGLDASVLGEQVSELTGNEMMRQQLLAYLRQYGVGVDLTVKRTPTVNKSLNFTRTAATFGRRRPTRRRDTIGEQLLNTPTLGCYPCAMAGVLGWREVRNEV